MTPSWGPPWGRASRLRPCGAPIPSSSHLLGSRCATSRDPPSFGCRAPAGLRGRVPRAADFRRRPVPHRHAVRGALRPDRRRQNPLPRCRRGNAGDLHPRSRCAVVGPLVLGFGGRGLAGRLLRSTYADPRKVTEPDVDQYYAPVAEAAYGRALRGVLHEFKFGGLEGRLDAIAAPTLVLWGEADRLIPIALGRALAAQLNRSVFLSVPRAGHSVQEGAPDEVNGLLIKFFKEGLPRVPGNLARREWRPRLRGVHFINHVVEKLRL